MNNYRSIPGTGGQVWALQDSTFVPINANKDFVMDWNILKNGAKPRKINHKVFCNIIMLWLQDLRLLEWPQEMEGRGEELAMWEMVASLDPAVKVIQSARLFQTFVVM